MTCTSAVELAIGHTGGFETRPYGNVTDHDCRGRFVTCPQMGGSHVHSNVQARVVLGGREGRLASRPYEYEAAKAVPLAAEALLDGALVVVPPFLEKGYAVQEVDYDAHAPEQ